MSESRLSVEALVEEAQRRSGFSDAGAAEYLPALSVLVQSFNDEAALSPLGRELQANRLSDLLANRFGLEEYIRRYPEILAESIKPPIFIVGLPRTGTTMLQRIISVEPQLLGTRWYELRFLIPELNWNFKPETDARIPKAKAEVAALIAANPDLLAIHPFDAMKADEDLLLLENTFMTMVPSSQAHVPSYNQFFEQGDMVPAYRYHKKMLQFLQWQRRRSGEKVDGKRWVLKTPAHMHDIEALFAVYPSAQLIQSHRDPLACMASLSSFYYSIWKVYSDDAAPYRCGDVTMKFFSRALQRMLTAQTQRPDQVLDLDYRELIKTPDQAMRKIYRFIDLPLEQQTLQSMQEWREQNNRENRAEHKYNLAEYGLTEQTIHESFAAYYGRHPFGESV